jgi:hypothetical protein
MDQRIKKLWIKALRSEKYTQGYGQLKRGRGKNVVHCCLGVLEEIAKQQGVIKTFCGANGGLDQKVMKWAGLDDSLPTAGGKRLHTVNDSRRNDFSDIAALIETYL